MTFTDARLLESGGSARKLESGDVRTLESYVPTGAFDPGQLSGLAAWYDAADADTFSYSSGVLVSQWRDKSPKALHLAQAATGQQPSRNGARFSPSVVFDGGRYLFHSTSTGINVGTVTLFTVYAESFGFDNAGITSLHAASGNDYDNPAALATTQAGTTDWCSAIRYASGVAGTTRVPGTGLTPWGVNTNVFRADGTLSNSHNGVAGSSTPRAGTFTVADGGLLVGGRWISGVVDGSYRFYGDIGEIIIYDRVLTAPEITQVEDYLAAKWLPPPTVPDAPTSLSVIAQDSQVALTWTAPANNGGAVVTDYVVQFRTSAVPGAWTTFTDAVSTATAATVTGLTNDTSYDFQVAAVNVAGQGAYSATAAATPVAPSGGDAQVLQHAYYSGNGNPTPPHLAMASNLTSGSKIWVIVFSYQQTITAPTASSGSYTWTQHHSVGPTGDWRIAVHSANNPSTSNPGFRPGIADNGSYYQFAVIETLGGALLSITSALQVIGSASLGPVATVDGGAVIGIVQTSGPTLTIRCTTPPDVRHHDINVDDGNGVPASQSASLGAALTTDSAGITLAATISDFVAPYYNQVLFTLQPG